MDGLDIVVEDARWDALDLETLVLRAAREALLRCTLDPQQCEMTVLACDDLRIAALNAEFREKPAATNVLSWPAEERAAEIAGGIPQAVMPGLDGMYELGDIAISFDTCQAEAEAASKPLQAHVTHLIVHGVLHLLGYDHVDDADATLMEQYEVEILGNLGLDDPYMEIVVGPTKTG